MSKDHSGLNPGGQTVHTMPGGTSTSTFGSKPGTITSGFYSYSGVQTYIMQILTIKIILGYHYSHRGVKISVYRIQFICKKFAHWPQFQVKFENKKNQFLMVILMHTLVIHTGEYKLVCSHRYDFVKKCTPVKI